MYVSDSSSSSSEGDERVLDMPVKKKIKYEEVEQDKSDSDTDVVDSSESGSSSSSSEEETVIEKKKCKIKVKHSVDKIIRKSMVLSVNMRNRLLVNFVRLRNQNQIHKRKEKLVWLCSPYSQPLKLTPRKQLWQAPSHQLQKQLTL